MGSKLSKSGPYMEIWFPKNIYKTAKMALERETHLEARSVLSPELEPRAGARIELQQRLIASRDFSMSSQCISTSPAVAPSTDHIFNMVSP